MRKSVSGKRTQFVGYERLLVAETSVQAIARLDAAGAERTDVLAAGERGAVVIATTPFYADAGGQLGDRGLFRGRDFEARVLDTRKDDGVHYHFVEVDVGSIQVGDAIEAEVDSAWRRPTERHHTATHLLQAALRHVLGSGVRQAGSLVAPDRLRFDFTHGEALTKDQIRRVEDLVNRWVLAARETKIRDGRDFEEAVAAGAMALFGEKYGDRVRTVEVPPIEEAGQQVGSLELCGGCHVRNVGEIGLFVITSERGVASGVRRIEARTGEVAQALFRSRSEVLEVLSGRLDVGEDRIVREIETLLERRRSLEQELSSLRLKLLSGKETGEEREVDGIKVLVREVPAAPANEMRNMADVLRARLGSGVVVLASADEGKVSLVTAVTEDLTSRVHAGRLAQKIGAIVGGKGGGRADFAQAGGKLADQLPRALESVDALIGEELTVP